MVPLERFAILTVDSLNDEMKTRLHASDAGLKQLAQERSASPSANLPIYQETSAQAIIFQTGGMGVYTPSKPV
jgi:hypothetical protein